jgi:chromosome segregation protein
LHLRTLTLRGFKSFASTTTLHFEPGITCVVGPNGSGKSNVVDALAWVMGEQGVKSLRGGKMEDVIFAGTSGRPPLGRAEVVLTIDNTDGALPIDYSEVTISRTMFRSGGSEYAINGNSCRLLDIQELLSDSGIGREIHVVVGQGQLDAILSASPEDRRGFIEEAAGVLKHRKRKEKALRKLDAMQANLTRLQDLTAELRRQLKPLGKQAEIARKASVIQADLRDAKLRLLADDLVELRAQLDQEVADETALRDRRTGVETDLATAKDREQALDQALAAASPRLAQTQETWYRLAGLRERFRGTASLAAERARHLAAESEDERRGREPADMEDEAAKVKAEEASLAELAERDRADLAEAIRRRTETEAALAAEEKRVTGLLRALADRREGVARLAGKVSSLESKIAAADAELGRLTAAHRDAVARARLTHQELESLRAGVEGLAESEAGLDADHQATAAALAAAERRVAELREQERAAASEEAALTARKEALELGLGHKDGAGALLAATDRLDGLLGSVAALLTVRQGAQAAVAAALGSAADAVVVADLDAAVAALRLLKADDGGRAHLLVGTVHNSGPGEGSPIRTDGRESWPALPPGAVYAVDLVEAPAVLRRPLTKVLHRVAVVDDLAAARILLSEHPDLSAVTREGDFLGQHVGVGGSTSVPSLIEIQAAVDDAGERLVEVSARCADLRSELAKATATVQHVSEQAEEIAARLSESDSQQRAIAEQVARLGASARAAASEAERIATVIAAADAARVEDVAGLGELQERLAAASAASGQEEPSTDYRDRLVHAGTTARQTEMECRLAVRTAEERIRALAGRAEQLTRAAEQERTARARAAARRERQAREARVALAVAAGANHALSVLELSLRSANAERGEAEHARGRTEGELQVLRTKIRELGGDLEQLTDTVHRDEMARAEQRMRIEQLEQRALDEHGIDVPSLIADYGPDQPVPSSPEPPGEATPPRPYRRAEQEKRLKAAERSLALLGKVNPLALEEFSALEERHKFLTEQLEDLKNTRRDLLTVIKEVDERVEQVFAAAYEDTAREFSEVFARLFPGGEGHLALTDPHDMLTTGIEVEARPPGKKIKRLSLLSGGERSLVAVALLIAIFKARPSPFYVLDEVEAALDDINLGRLLTILEELRESSQLIVITHQKRTMEIADALYGTSMRNDGVTTIIGQRLRDSEHEPIVEAATA